MFGSRRWTSSGLLLNFDGWIPKARKGRLQKIVPDGFGHRHQDDGYQTQSFVEHQATTAAENHGGS